MTKESIEGSWNFSNSEKFVNPCGLIESPPRLGLRTILGLLGQSLTYMGPRTRLWV